MEKVEKMQQLEESTRAHADANEALTALKREMSSEFENIRAKYHKKLKSVVEYVVKTKEELSSLIEESPELFVKPKTLTINGIKVGFQKDKDSVEYKKDENKTIELIEDIYSDDQDKIETLIKTTKKALKSELIKLTDEELKDLKCKRITGEDEIVIKTIDTEIDKFVNNLIKVSESVEAA